VIDYIWSTAFSSAPEWFGFARDARARLFCRAMGGAMTMSLFTRYEMGVVKVLPFNIHLAGDVLSVVAGFAGLALTKQNSKARNAILGFTVFEIGALILSKRDPH
jgi:hypothetical protein